MLTGGSMALTLRRTTATTRYYTEPLNGLGNAIPPQMLLIPSGTFTMGSPDDEPKRNAYYEERQPNVSVSEFFMGRYPITQAQWRAVVAMPQIDLKLQPDPSKFKGDNRPVEQVNWHEAVEFCARLSAHTGRPYRLPSDEEWEYACRAGTTTPFYFGRILTTEVANYDGRATYGDGSRGDYQQETTPVDYFNLANAFGLCDMHGNVAEWCKGIMSHNFSGPPTVNGDYARGGGTFRRQRGGSWKSMPEKCRSASSDRYEDPDFRRNDVGFRVVSVPPDSLP